MTATGTGATSLRLGNYEPLLELASGGMATVFVARHVGAKGFERLVVLKRVHPHLLGNREFTDMFTDEARIASLIHHPNVVPVIDVVESERELLLVMEYVESAALSTLISNTKNVGIPTRIVARIIADALAGLHAAHQALDMRGEPMELVHRDVSPQNIIVGKDGTTRLIDFGIAHAADRLTQTKTGSLKGKLAYMAPEQASGLPSDRRVDIFACGVTLHEALVGKRLFRGENELDTMRRIMEAPIPAPSSVLPSISVELDAVVLRALERNPRTRYQTAAEFLDALEGAITPASAREVSAFLVEHCGSRLAERAQELQGILEGRMPKRRFSLVGAPGSPTVVDGQVRSSQREVPPAAPSSGSFPHTSRSPLIDGAFPQTQSGVHIPTVSAVLVEPAFVPSGPGSSNVGVGAQTLPSQRPGVSIWAIAGAVIVVGVALKAGTTFLGREPSPAPIVVAAPTPPVMSVAPAMVSNDVELILTADAPIESVRTGGSARRIEFQNGRAHVFMAPWTGTLALEAQLVGGRVARADADARGPRDIRLVVIPLSKGLSPKKLPSGPAVPDRPQDLQDNPYGSTR
jgi:serine/threonine protein kinase